LSGRKSRAPKPTSMNWFCQSALNYGIWGENSGKSPSRIDHLSLKANLGFWVHGRVSKIVQFRVGMSLFQTAKTRRHCGGIETFECMRRRCQSAVLLKITHNVESSVPAKVFQPIRGYLAVFGSPANCCPTTIKLSYRK
jgi:hypothetical protein